MTPRKVSAKYILIALSAVITYNANAKCIFPPLKQADVIVQSCVGVTFSGSNSQVNFGQDKNANYYAQGASYSGTLITARVKKSWFVWAENEKHITNGFHLWPHDKSLMLFVAGNSDVVCPKQLFEPIRIQTTRFCCDVGPLKGQCLVPGSIETVTVVSE